MLRVWVWLSTASPAWSIHARFLPQVSSSDDAMWFQEEGGIAPLVFKPSFPRYDCLGQEGNPGASDSEQASPDRATEPLAADATGPQSNSGRESKHDVPDALARTAEPGQAIRSPQDGSPAGLSAPRVLLAEDNRDLQRILIRQLNLLGLEVVGVMNGRDAALSAQAALAAGNPFDLILMDMEMPIIDGYEATRQIRGSGFSGPILALSAHSTGDIRRECMEIGCNDCIPKPLDWGSLSMLIRKHVACSLAPGLVLARNR